MTFQKQIQGWTKFLLIISNLSLYFTAIATWISIPDSLILNSVISLAAIFMTLGLIYWQREQFKTYWEGPYFKNLTSSLVSLSLVFFILGILNYWSFKHPMQIDLTSNESNSLSLQTVEILKNISGPVKFKVFTRRGDQSTIIPLLELYRSYKNDIAIELFDPDLKPELVKQFKVQHYGTVIVEGNGRYQSFLGHNEKEVTKALLKIGRSKHPTFYYTTGHQELDWENKEKQGLFFLQTLLKQEFYSIKPLNLALIPSLEDQSWPNDLDGLIIWGPKNAFFPHELHLIEEYIKKGGRLLVGIDPDFNKNPVEGLTNLLKRWGIQVNNDLVVDIKSYVNGSNFTVPIVTQYNQKHPITQNFQHQTFFPLATSLHPIAKNEDPWEVAPLLFTNNFPASWAEKNFNEVLLENIHFTSGEDEEGPINLMLAMQDKLENAKSEGRQRRIVVVGNSTFVQNAYSQYQSNFQLFIQALSWLADDEFLLLPSSKGKTSVASLMLSAPQVGIIFYFSLIFGPLILLILAFYFYKKKQKL